MCRLAAVTTPAVWSSLCGSVLGCCARSKGAETHLWGTAWGQGGASPSQAARELELGLLQYPV